MAKVEGVADKGAAHCARYTATPAAQPAVITPRYYGLVWRPLRGTRECRFVSQVRYGFVIVWDFDARTLTPAMERWPIGEFAFPESLGGLVRCMQICEEATEKGRDFIGRFFNGRPLVAEGGPWAWEVVPAKEDFCYTFTAVEFPQLRIIWHEEVRELMAFYGKEPLVAKGFRTTLGGLLEAMSWMQRVGFAMLGIDPACCNLDGPFDVDEDDEIVEPLPLCNKLCLQTAGEVWVDPECDRCADPAAVRASCALFEESGEAAP